MKCSVATLNCCLSVCPPLRFNGAFARARRLVDAVYSSIPASDLDIICLQELVSGRNEILKNFIQHPYHSHKVESSLFGNNIRVVHAGLATVSRWPILEEDAHVFSGKTYHLEAFMAKAVQYTKILMHESVIVHVFNTHLQAWTNERASAIRLEQMRQIGTFMQKKLLGVCRKTQLVVLAGDFNVDGFEHAESMEKLMREVNMSMVMPLTPQFSFDPTVNPLVGTDDAAEYAVKGNLDGCYDDFIQNGTCSCCPKQLVDGVAVLKEQLDASFVTSAIANVVPILSRAPFEIMVNMSTRRTIQTISDHFAVYVQFDCRIQNLDASAIKFEATHRNCFRPKMHLGWILFELVLFFALLLLFWTVCSCIGKLFHRHKK